MRMLVQAGLTARSKSSPATQARRELLNALQTWSLLNRDRHRPGWTDSSNPTISVISPRNWCSRLMRCVLRVWFRQRATRREKSQRQKREVCRQSLSLALTEKFRRLWMRCIPKYALPCADAWYAIARAGSRWCQLPALCSQRVNFLLQCIHVGKHISLGR